MAFCKCKMCGGQINYETNQTVATCEFCGTKQTIAVTDDIRQLNLHNRANSLRLANEFDKALATYEAILADNPKDAEAHWCMCLCKYGIEYIDDSKTNKKIPTCHRTVFASIFDDIDYKEAIENADVLARKIYQIEADKIDKIQKNIISISQKETPYDIFICYKEKDKAGNRTKDSVIAQEIYNSLTQNGYKVFFARITLESKIGSQYEPIIFAALQSSKVMLVIGSKIEYFNAPWVKNEWGRFLSFMKENRGKYFIPCYKDMEAYDMPDEFLSFQSQDIDKIGFLQDLIRGINKIFDKKEVVRESSSTQTATTTNPKIKNIIKRMYLCVEDKDYEKANELIEIILNENVECVDAYIASLLMDLELTKEEDIPTIFTPLDDNRNYKKAIRFASPEYREKLKSYNETIKENIIQKKTEEIYQEAKLLHVNKKFDKAIELFEQISNYKNSSFLINQIRIDKEEDRKEKIYQANFLELKKITNLTNPWTRLNQFEACIKTLEEIKDYKDTKDVIEDQKNKLEEKYASQYSLAEHYIKHKQIDKAIDTLSKIPDYKDSQNLIQKLNQEKTECIYTSTLSRIDNILLVDDYGYLKHNFWIELAKLADIKDYKDSKQQIIKYQKIYEEKIKSINKKRKKRNAIIICCVVVVIVFFIVLASIIPTLKYNTAIRRINSNDYDGAVEILKNLDHKDSDKLISLTYAKIEFEQNNYQKGIKYVLDANEEIYVSYNGDGVTLSKEHEIINKSNPEGYLSVSSLNDSYEITGWEIESYDVKIEKSDISISLCLKAVKELIFEAEILTDEVHITGVNSVANINALILPNSIEGKSVTQICDDAFAGCASLTSIVIPDSVTSIGENAFLNCSSLVNVEMGNGIKSIGKSAFNYCTSLETIILPKNLTKIEEKVFYNCSKLKSITMHENLISIGYAAFAECRALKNITIPNSVINIDARAFWNCSELVKINIPSKIATIKESTFFGCSSLENIVIPFYPTSIGDYAFAYCNSLASVEIGDSIRSIGKGAFSYCESLETVILPKNLTKIEDGLFYDCLKLKDVIIQEGVTSIGNTAFLGCKTLEQITIPNNVKSIGTYAFSSCISLNNIVIPRSVTSIGNGAFYYCLALNSVFIHNSVTYVGENAFCGKNIYIYCEHLTKPFGWSTEWATSDCVVHWGVNEDQI